jgi:DNA repair protein RadA/Sms
MAEMKLNVARGFKAGTRIKSIDVPAELRAKQTSGIEWLDDALGGEGGFTPTSTMMLTGAPGAGKSTLLRMLANTMTKSGHIVVYNTGEESLYQAKMACERLKLEENFMVAEEVMLPKLLTFMDSVKNDPKNKGKQIVLLQDSLQTLDDGKYAAKDGTSRGTTSKTPTYCTQMIVDWIQANFGIGIFIGQCNKGGEFAGQATIKYAVDVHSHLYFDEKEKSDTYGCLLFEVQKNRWGCNGKTYILSLSKTGLEERGHFRKAGTSSDT